MPAMRSLTFLALPLFALLLLCLPSCAWREIDVRADDAAIDFTFGLYDPQKPYYVSNGQGDTYTIGCNGYEKQIRKDSEQGKRLTALIQEVLDIGEYTRRIKWDDDPFLNYYKKNSAYAIWFNLLSSPHHHWEKKEYRWYLDVPAVRERTDKVHAALRQLFEEMFKDMPKSRPEKDVDDTKLV